MTEEDAFNGKELNLWRWFAEKTPNLTLMDVKYRISDHMNDAIGRHNAESALIVLLEVLGANSSGHGVEKLSNDKRPRVRWAMREALRAHAGVACSPFSGGFERFNSDMDYKGKDIVIYNQEESHE